MEVYRLIKARYADSPFDPEGAKLYGGRWNSKGIKMVYASDSIALAALEKLVHIHRSDVLNHFVLCEASIKEDDLMELDPSALPDDWRNDPAPSSTALIGDSWIEEGSSLALSVPSTIVPEQRNILINPNHPAFLEMLDTVLVRPFDFDPRLSD